MTNGGDAAEQIVRLSLEGFEVAAKLSGSAAKNIAVLLASTLKQEMNQTHKTKGKARLSNMIKSGKPLTVFAIQNKNIKKFAEQAKRYGVLYCVLRDKSNSDPNATVDIIARTEDASKIQRISERFELGKVDKTSIVTNVEKEKSDRQEVEIEQPTKTCGERAMEEAMGKPIQKEGQTIAHPTVAKAEKSPLSEQNSTASVTRTDEGIAKESERKPSVKEKLERFRSQARKQKETERTEPTRSQEKPKAPEPNRQTVHTQPKTKQKYKER